MSSITPGKSSVMNQSYIEWMRDNGKYSFKIPHYDHLNNEINEFSSNCRASNQLNLGEHCSQNISGGQPVIHTPQVTPEDKVKVMGWLNSWLDSILKRDFDRNEINYHLWIGAQMKRKIMKQPPLPSFRPRDKLGHLIQPNPPQIPRSLPPNQLMSSQIPRSLPTIQLMSSQIPRSIPQQQFASSVPLQSNPLLSMQNPNTQNPGTQFQSNLITPLSSSILSKENSLLVPENLTKTNPLPNGINITINNETEKNQSTPNISTERMDDHIPGFRYL